MTINRPPRDGHMAFIRTPDNISIELIQKGSTLPAAEPWASMGEHGRMVGRSVIIAGTEILVHRGRSRPYSGSPARPWPTQDDVRGADV